MTMIFMFSFHLGTQVWSFAFAPFMWHFGAHPLYHGGGRWSFGPFSFMWGIQ